VKRFGNEHPRLTIGEYGDASAAKALSPTPWSATSAGPILSVPVTLAVLLFGFGALVAAGIPVLLALTAVAAALGLLAWPRLSMDYVVILTRVREAVDGGLDTDQAVSDAIRTTAGVVTNAALVMVGVFSIFATLSRIDLKQLGVGLAAAILIDATIVRGILLPAAMKLLGRWNWYLPRWLQWLPRLDRPQAAVARAGC
jgi:uncharacterized membrane protein YdfJ with MMPL/SSD domain